MTAGPALSADPLAALEQRLRTAAVELLDDVPEASGILAHDGGALLDALVADPRTRVDHARVWLLLVALTGQFPVADTVRGTRRKLELLSVRDGATWLLARAAGSMDTEDATSFIELVTDRPLVDVDFTSGNDLSTGIQRVVRNLIPRWSRDHPLTLVRWHDDKAYVGLNDHQARRVLGDDAEITGGIAEGVGDQAPVRLVPWGASVLLPEVPFPGHGERLAALAEFTPNRVCVIGYDCIPAVSAELVGNTDREKFGEYLELIKYTDTVAGISASAAAEFDGFVAALSVQGLRGPRVVACGLPTTEVVAEGAGATLRQDLPEVLCVGSLDRRKNQIALVEAAEHLWRAGLDFRLRLLGSGGGRPLELRRLIDRLVERGRPLAVAQEVSDDVLDGAYRHARVVVFPTLHEGFGLPVVEALSYGVPVITSDFGSTREIADGVGSILVDPEDPFALAAAIRQVLTDDTLHQRLVSQARSRTPRTWDDYAAESWQVLVS